MTELGSRNYRWHLSERSSGSSGVGCCDDGGGGSDNCGSGSDNGVGSLDDDGSGG